jgi:hypothetical protein
VSHPTVFSPWFRACRTWIEHGLVEGWATYWPTTPDRFYVAFFHPPPTALCLPEPGLGTASPTVFSPWFRVCRTWVECGLVLVEGRPTNLPATHPG